MSEPKYPFACECGGVYETEDEFHAHLRSDFKDHPIHIDPGFSKGIKDE